MNLINTRKNIDKLDEAWIKIIQKRMKLISDIAFYKKQNMIKRYQAGREKAIIIKNTRLALKLKLNPDLVVDILKRVIKESHKIEKDIIGK
jgi:chorismate mutase